MDKQSFEATYAQMTERELAKVLRGRRNLVPDARKALDHEIQKRRLDPTQLRKLRPRSIDKPWRRTKLGRFSEKIGIERLRTKRIRGLWLIAIIALSFLLAALLGHLGVLQFFWPINITIVVPVFTVWGHWELKGRPWFWVTIAAVMSVHVVFFYFVGWPWGTRWVPARAVEGFCTFDIIAVFVIIWLVEKLLHEDQGVPLKQSIKE
jgi:hypothetical protein